MAFDARDFTQVSTNATGAMRVFAYKTTADAIATCVASGYYNTYATQIRTGDIVICDASDVTRISRLVNTANVITCTVALSFA
jgi:hypothetical protein